MFMRGLISMPVLYLFFASSNDFYSYAHFPINETSKIVFIQSDVTTKFGGCSV